MKLAYSPFIEKRDELAVARDDDSRFLGRSMFWRYFDRIIPKHLYRSVTVEYRTMKLMLLESVMIIFCASLFSAYVAYAFDGRSNPAVVEVGRYWESGSSNVVDIDSMYYWLENDLLQSVFPQNSVYSNLTNVTTAPEGWVFMDEVSAQEYVHTHGLYEITSTNPGWVPHYIGGVPFMGNLLMGSVRIRLINVVEKVSCSTGALVCYPEFNGSNQNETRIVPANISSTAQDSFIWRSDNYTLQSSVAGRITDYPGSGYILDVSINKTESNALLKELQASNWIDNSTRAVIVEESALNSRVDAVFNVVQLFEIPTSGDVIYSTTMNSIPIPSQTVSVSMILAIATLSCFVTYSAYLLFLMFHTGVIDFFSSIWNWYDLGYVGLFMYSMALTIGPVNDCPTILSPLFASLQSWFMPFSFYTSRTDPLRLSSGIVCIFAWFRLIKCLTLLGPIRPISLVFERCIFLILFGLLLSGYAVAFAGFAVGFYFALNDESVPYEFFSTIGNSFYSTAFMFTKSVQFAILSDDSSFSYPLLCVFIGYVVVVVLLMQGYLLGVTLYSIKEYRAEIAAALAVIESDKTALYPPGIDRHSFWHRDLLRIFCFSWVMRVRGRELVEEKEEDVGTPDEQVIDLDLLPSIIQERWKLKKAELINYLDKRNGKMGRDMRKAASKFGERKRSTRFDLYYQKVSQLFVQPLFQRRSTSKKPKSGGTMASSSSFGGRSIFAKDESHITRIQLQRLLDSDEQLVNSLLSSTERAKDADINGGVDGGAEISSQGVSFRIRAIDLIRKYGTRAALTRKHIFENFLGADSLNGENVKKGLTGYVAEIAVSWRNEHSVLVDLVEAFKGDVAIIKRNARAQLMI